MVDVFFIALCFDFSLFYSSVLFLGVFSLFFGMFFICKFLAFMFVIASKFEMSFENVAILFS